MALAVKNLSASAGDVRDVGSVPRLGRQPWRRVWQPTPVLLPGDSHGQRSMVGYSPLGCAESDTTEQLSTTDSEYLLFSSNFNSFREGNTLHLLNKNASSEMIYLQNQLAEAYCSLPQLTGLKLICGFRSSPQSYPARFQSELRHMKAARFHI